MNDNTSPSIDAFCCVEDRLTIHTLSRKLEMVEKALESGIAGISTEHLQEAEHQLDTAIRNICEHYVRIGGGPGKMGGHTLPHIFRNSSGVEVVGSTGTVAMMAAFRGQVLSNE